MGNEKIALIGAAILMLAFVGFMLYDMNSRADYANHPIDESIPIATGNSNQQAAPSAQQQPIQQPPTQQLQVVSVHALSTGVYDNPQLTVKAGVPVRLDFTAEPGSGCGAQLILDGVGTRVNLVSRNGQTVSATFTPPKPGRYAYHCGMNMFRGVLIAT